MKSSAGCPGEEGAVLRRRRGAELEDAICRAAFEELSETGYGGFTMDSVASRAGTGKASIYRRWPSKNELLMDAFCRGIPEPADALSGDELETTQSTREALLAVIRMMAIAPSAEKKAAMRGMAGQTAQDPEFAEVIERLLMTPRREDLARLLRRGIALGDVDPHAPIDLVAELVPAYFMQRFLFRHVETTEADAIALVDDVAMPLLSGTSYRVRSEAALKK